MGIPQQELIILSNKIDEGCVLSSSATARQSFIDLADHLCWVVEAGE
jgi:hypothetical protein